jgi:hypothetical protein
MRGESGVYGPLYAPRSAGAPAVATRARRGSPGPAALRPPALGAGLPTPPLCVSRARRGSPDPAALRSPMPPVAACHTPRSALALSATRARRGSPDPAAPPDRRSPFYPKPHTIPCMERYRFHSDGTLFYAAERGSVVSVEAEVGRWWEGRPAVGQTAGSGNPRRARGGRDRAVVGRETAERRGRETRAEREKWLTTLPPPTVGLRTLESYALSRPIREPFQVEKSDIFS